MPEGHTIHRATRRLRSVLAGHRIERVRATAPQLQASHAQDKLTGSTVESVTCHGKNLFINFDNGLSIHSHLKMDGAWHLYRTGERWRRPGSHAWLVLDTGEWQAVEFGGPVLELRRTEDLARDRDLVRLGPDILLEPFDDAEYLRRMRENDWREIGDALMRQHLVAGIGNIYKSETLFLGLTDPWRTVGSLSDEELLELRRIATAIMQDGVLDPRAITFHGPGRPGHWAYHRSGQPCRRCGATIQSREQGEDRRVTYWCPTCQH